MFWLVVSFSLSREKVYFTSINGEENNICSRENPCSYKRIIRVVKPFDRVEFLDNEISKTHELEKVRILINSLVSMEVKINGNNMVINGSLYRPIDQFFIVSHHIGNVSLSQIVFSGFKTPVIAFQAVDNGVLTDIVFTQNHIMNCFCLVLATISSVIFNNVNFTENSVCNASLIFFSTTNFQGNRTLFERNFIEHDSSQTLFRCLNSNLDLMLWNIKSNSGHDGPLMYFDYRSIVYMTYCIIEDNHHPEIMICDGLGNFTFYQTKIRRNKGLFFEATQATGVCLHESSFNNNYSGDEPMFYLPGSYFISSFSSKIKNNYGKVFVEQKGMKSYAVISDSYLAENTFNDAVFSSDSETTISVRNSIFSRNWGKQGVFIMSNARLDVIGMHSIQQIEPVFNLSKASGTIFNSNFTNEFSSSLNIIESDILIFDTLFNSRQINKRLRKLGTGHQSMSGSYFQKAIESYHSIIDSISYFNLILTIIMIIMSSDSILSMLRLILCF